MDDYSYYRYILVFIKILFIRCSSEFSSSQLFRGLFLWGSRFFAAILLNYRKHRRITNRLRIRSKDHQILERESFVSSLCLRLTNVLFLFFMIWWLYSRCPFLIFNAFWVRETLRPRGLYIIRSIGSEKSCQFFSYAIRPHKLVLSYLFIHVRYSKLIKYIEKNFFFLFCISECKIT